MGLSSPPVALGDVVFTKFELSEASVWTLSMGLKGSEPASHSVVEATAPFMGLLPDMPSWDDPLFNTTRAGTCWEVGASEGRLEYALPAKPFSSESLSFVLPAVS